MIALLAASTLYQVASLAALADAGALPSGQRRVLVLATGSQQPELTTPLHQAPGFAELSTRFDAVVDLAELIWPRRPQAFSPREEELLMWQRLLRSHWGLGSEPVTLYLESVQVNPAMALARIFHDAPITVHSDGLMSYGPTRNRLPVAVAQRLDALVYVDLVPGLTPVLLREFAPQLTPVPRAPLAAVFRELAAATQPSAVAASLSGADDVALMLGQYLVPLGVLTPEQQAELDEQMLVAALHAGARTVAYKPHPSVSAGSTAALSEEAAELGLALVVLPDEVPAELLMLWLTPRVVISGFSTSLFTAAELFGLPATAVGFESVGPELSPFQNSNRVPLVLADALFGPETSVTGPEVQGLVDAVAYCMQSQRLPELRAAAEVFLAEHPELRDRYIKQRRLRALRLPSAGPRPTVTGRSPRAVARRVLRARLGEDGAQTAISRIHAARHSLKHTPSRALGKLGSTLVSWSKNR